MARPKPPTAGEIAVARSARVRELCEKLHGNVEMLITQSQQNPADWSYPGALEHVIVELQDLVRFTTRERVTDLVFKVNGHERRIR